MSKPFEVAPIDVEWEVPIVVGERGERRIVLIKVPVNPRAFLAHLHAMEGAVIMAADDYENPKPLFGVFLDGPD